MKLELRNINKFFGDFEVLKDISFTATSGRALGFLGRNGAGKTTTIRTLVDVFRPNSGEFLLNDKKFDPNKHLVGYLPEQSGMYDKEKILPQLIYFGKLKGLSKKVASESALYWLDYLKLKDYKNKKLSTLSKGNQQKIQIIQALLGEPDILIFDEPFSGLDPVNSESLKQIIREQIQQEKIVIFSSHQMSYVEEFCDDIVLINKGEIVLSGELEKIKLEMGKNKLVLKAYELSTEELKSKISSISDIDIELNNDSLLITLLNGKSKNTLLSELLELDINIDTFSIYRPSLNEIFVEYVGGENE